MMKFFRAAALKVLEEGAMLCVGGLLLAWFCTLLFVPIVWFGAFVDSSLKPWAWAALLTHGAPMLAAFCGYIYDEVRNDQD